MLRLENNIDIYLKLDSLKIIQRGTGKIFEFDLDKNGKEFVYYLQETKLFKKENIKKAWLQFVEIFLDLKILTQRPIDDMTNKHRSQMQSFREWDLEPLKAMNSLENTRVLVIGTGGIGGHLIYQLASLGVRHFIVVDPDVVKEANIPRQVFNLSQINQYKVDSIEEIINQKNLSCEVIKVRKKIIKAEDLIEFEGLCDIVCTAADSPSRSEMALLVGSWALENNITHHVCGGYNGHHSALGLTIIPRKTLCWGCYQEWYKTQVSDYATEKPLFQSSKNPSGLLPLVNLAASMSALDIVKVITGMKPDLINARLDLYPEELKINKMEFASHKSCKYCKEI